MSTFMREFPWSTKTLPTTYVLPSQWPHPQNDETLLALQEAKYEDELNEIRKTNSNLIVIGKTTVENDKEDYDNDADDDEADHAEESEGDDFEQETG